MKANEVLYRIKCILDCNQHALRLQSSHTKRDREGAETDVDEEAGSSQSKRPRGEGEAAAENANTELLLRIQLLEAENKRLNGIVDAVREEIQCAVCSEPSSQDALLECGHNFCRPCLTSWSGTGRTAGRSCPLCRKPTEQKNQRRHLSFMRVVEAVKYTKIYDNGEKYIGDLRDGKRHGQGTCFYPNGHKYEGGWKEDSMFGQGVYTWKDGSVYKGEFLENSKSAQGVMTWANGQRYEGTWMLPNQSYEEDNEDSRFLFFDPEYFEHDCWCVADDPYDVYSFRYGDGLHTWPDGKRKKANFCEGVQHGPGEMTWPNGDRLTCEEWEFGFLKGIAEYVWHDGCRLHDVNSDKRNELSDQGTDWEIDLSEEKYFARDLQHHVGSYKGQWNDDGEWHGHGKLIYPLINFEYEGDFVNFDKHGHGKAKYGDGSTYDGEWQDDMMQGRGVYTWPDGSRYEGEYSGNQKNGQGVLTWPSGARYEGEFQDEKWHGHGTFTRSDGRTYEGSWEQFHKHGRGKNQNEDGSTYEGDWQMDKMHGRGVRTWTDGSTYEGEWQKDKMHGRGFYTWPDGRRYEGEYRDNKKDGLGICTWPDGSTYEGTWDKDQIHGHGKKYNADGSTYDGYWRHGTKHGHGKGRGADGSMYEGEWKKDKMHGQGVKTWANGDKYEGLWLRNNREGSGVMIYANGDKYEGSWHQDKRQGRGKMTLADGVEETGIWHDGERLPDAPSLDTDQLILLVGGLPPDLAKEVLTDALGERVIAFEDEKYAQRTHGFLGPRKRVAWRDTYSYAIADILLETNETYQIVQMLRSKEQFEDAFIEADIYLDKLDEIEFKIGGFPRPPVTTVEERLKVLEKMMIGNDYDSSRLSMLDRLMRLLDWQGIELED